MNFKQPSGHFSIEEFVSSGTICTSRPGYVWLGWGKRYKAAKPSPLGSVCYYFPDYFLIEPQPWFWYDNARELPLSGALNLLSGAMDCEKMSWSEPDWSLFKTAFEDLKEHIQQQKLQKAVPYLFTHSDETIGRDQLLRTIHQALLHAQKYPVYLFGTWENKEGILGATPELLLSIETSPKFVLKTVACAGTAESNAPLSALENNTKQLAEHKMVVDGISSALQQFGKVRKGQMHRITLSTLCHLLTPIEVDLNLEWDLNEIIEALHPTPALGAYPKVAGNSWLREYNRLVPRNRYGAPAGWINTETQESCCFVAIRNVQWDPRGARIGAGCGIVNESELQSEIDEVTLKIKSIREVLSL